MGRTDAEDLINAEEFARNLKSRNLIAFKQNTPSRKPDDLPGCIRGVLSILEEMG